MGFEINKETLQAVVEANKSSKSFFVTEDGHFFTKKNKSHAINHASGRKVRWKQVDPDGNEVSKSKEVISESEEDYNPVTDSAKNLQELVAEKKAAKEAEETAAKEVEEKAAKEAEETAAKEAEEKAAKEAEAKAAKEAEAKAAKEGRTKTTIKPGK